MLDFTINHRFVDSVAQLFRISSDGDPVDYLPGGLGEVSGHLLVSHSSFEFHSFGIYGSQVKSRANQCQWFAIKMN